MKTTNNQNEIVAAASRILFAQARKSGREFRLPPYALAARLGITTHEAQKVVKQLCERGTIEKIGTHYCWTEDL